LNNFLHYIKAYNPEWSTNEEEGERVNLKDLAAAMVTAASNSELCEAVCG